MKVQNLPFCCALLTLFFCCNNKQPYYPDYGMAHGIIIGRESCSSDPSKNAWLIQFTRQLNKPKNGSTNFGGEITYKGKTYANVVKIYNLPDTSKTDAKLYSFDFDLDTSTIRQECDVEHPVTFDVPSIQLRGFGGIW